MIKRVAVFLIFALVLTAGCSLADIPLKLDKEKDENIIIKPQPPEVENSEGEQQPQDNLPPEGSVPTMLYYLDTSGEHVIPLTRYLTKTKTNIRDSLQQLISSPGLTDNLSRLGLKAPLPGGTEILGLNLHEDKLLTVDLNTRFLDYPTEEERQVITAVVYTVTQFPEVDRVEFQVDGVPLTSFPGELSFSPPIGGEIGINLEIADQVSDYSNAMAMTLFYYIRPNPQEQTLMIPVMRVIPQREDLLSACLEELFQSPKGGNESKVFSAIPPETKLISTSVEDGTVTVNLSSDVYLYAGGKTGERSLLCQLAATIMSLDDNYEDIVLLVEGSPPAFPHSTPAEHPAALLPPHLNQVDF